MVHSVPSGWVPDICQRKVRGLTVGEPQHGLLPMGDDLLDSLVLLFNSAVRLMIVALLIGFWAY